MDYIALVPSKESAAKIKSYIFKYKDIFLTPERNVHSTVRYPNVNPFLDLNEKLLEYLFSFPSITLDPRSYSLEPLGESLVLRYEHPKVVELHNHLSNQNSEMEKYLQSVGLGINSPYNFSDFVPHITLSQPPFGKDYKKIPVFSEPITLEGILI